MKNKKYFIFIITLFIFLLNATFSPIFAQLFERIENSAGLGILANNNGVAVADYDNDNDLDIFIVAKSQDTPNDNKTFSKLFRNDNNGAFTDVTNEAGLSNLFTIEEFAEINPALTGFKYSVAWGDYNNDGFADLFLTNEYKIQLFQNNGNGTFTDKTTDAGLKKVNNCWNMGATWFDFNNDGFLDIYIADWGNCEYNSFYLNNGDGTFKNVSKDFYISEPHKKTYVSFPFDFNNDGFMDLYLSNDHNYKNEVFINNNGNSFIESSGTYQIGNQGNDMGIAISDYNNDGFFDFFVTNINNNVFYKNNGDNTFIEIATEKNMNNTGWSWDAVFADFDLDRDEDLFIVNGFTLPKDQYNTYFENLWNEDKDEFIDKSEQVNLKELTMSVGATPFDYDNDGDLDLFVTNTNAPSFFYNNTTITSNSTNNKNWFKIALVGTTSNKSAIGTTVSVKTNNGTLHRYFSGIGFISQSIQPVHFGLNNDSTIESVKIKWPSGLVETYTNIPSNSFIKATEGNGYEILNLNPSIKISGCTDPNSCNYNPLATENDGNCSYLQPSSINGPTNSAYNATNNYTYSLENGNSVIWTVEGGDIISGQGTSTIEIKWGFYETGKITAQEISEKCISTITELNVDLKIIKSTNNYSIVRIWNEALLEAIRNDFARPTVHARNLFHWAVATYDVWAIYNPSAKPYLTGNEVHNFKSSLEEFTPNEPEESSIQKAICYASYRLLTYRFKNSPGAQGSLKRFNLIMEQLGYDPNITTTNYQSGNAAALGNFVAETIINYGKSDGSNEENDYANSYYKPVNPPLNLGVTDEGTGIVDPNRWQPLTFSTFVDQSGNQIVGSTPDFLGPEWGSVNPFALTEKEQTILQRESNSFTVYNNPGSPPKLDLNNITKESELYKWSFSLVLLWSSHLDPKDPTIWDISPNSIGNIDFENFPKSFEEHPQFYNMINGGDISKGYAVNPSTGKPYEKQFVSRADYARVLAEFWADGPDSETPPGHWFTILNYVSDHPQFIRKFNGKGTIITPLEWDVKAYFILAGAMHDAAISAWGIKGWYDYIRPISAIRYMCELGQSSNKNLSNYNPAGIPLLDGFIEIIEEGDPLSGKNNEHVGKIKVFAWKGHDYIQNSETDIAGVGWILGENWWPYQRPSFVTPPFAGFVSGHSTFSRAAAEVLTLLTGNPYFPGGMGEFVAKKDNFLAFEKGPSTDVVLQWATYRDASDQTSLSRIWGGIHPPIDDIPGRIIGEKVGIEAYNFALPYFNVLENDESLQTNDFVIYPNPVEENYFSILNTTKDTSFLLYDILGKQVSFVNITFDTVSETKLEIPQNLASGIYLLKIDNTTKLLLIK